MEEVEIKKAPTDHTTAVAIEDIHTSKLSKNESQSSTWLEA